MLSGSPHSKPAPRSARSQSARPLFVDAYSKSNPKHENDSVFKFGPDSATPVGFGAAAIWSAYGLGTIGSGNISFSGVQGTGAGQTIALVDAYDDPNAASDLHQFSVANGLPDPPSFQKLNQTGGTSLPGTDNLGDPLGETWEVEESLDIEWAHVIAPLANLILFEATSQSTTNLYACAHEAASYPGVSVASMSWGFPESSSETSTDASTFFTPAGHQGVTFLASSGDAGGERLYPAMSPDVVQVGGTSLYPSSNGSYGTESAWGSGGGGLSAYESRPSYQVGTTDSYSTTKRSGPDLSMVADNATGVAVYDTYDFGTAKPWSADAVGGTSLSSPMVAGLIAIANQGRVSQELPTLNTPVVQTQTLTKLYQLKQADYHDITTGNNGHAATVGYDEASGRGSPFITGFVYDLVGVPTVTAQVYVDNNASGTYTASDTPIANVSVFLDLNGNGIQDPIEPSAVTSATGTATFTDVIGGGKVLLSSSAPAGYVAEAPVSNSINYGVSSVAASFGFLPSALPHTYTSTATGSTYTLQLNSAGNIALVQLNGMLIDTFSPSTTAAVTFNLNGSNESLVVNGTNGDPVPTGGITLAGTAGANSTLSLVGTGGADTFTVNSSTALFSGSPISYSSVSNLLLTPGAGSTSLNVSSAAVAIPALVAGAGLDTLTFSSLTVGVNGAVAFGTSPLHTDRYLVQTNQLSVDPTGSVDLGGNDMAIVTSSVSAINALAATGFAAGAWNGLGLRSSAATRDTARLHALGVESGAQFGIGNSFDGIAVTAGSVLVKYTWYGDANLDGKVDGSDYSRIDYALAAGLTGWSNGAFDYTSAISGSDYSLIDNMFNSPGGGL